MKLKAKILAVAACAIALTVALTGCGGGGNSADNAANFQGNWVLTSGPRSLRRRYFPSDSFTRNGATVFCFMKASSVQPFSMMMVISAMARRPSVTGAMGTHRLHFAAEEEYAGSMK